LAADYSEGSIPDQINHTATPFYNGLASQWIISNAILRIASRKYFHYMLDRNGFGV
jgi:hypothetical protein